MRDMLTFRGNNTSVDCAAHACSQITDINELLHFTGTFDENFPHLQSNKTPKFFFVLAQFIADITYDLSALRSWYLQK